MKLTWKSGHPTKIGTYIFRIRGGQIFTGKTSYCPDRSTVLMYIIPPNPWWCDFDDSYVINHIGPLNLEEPYE